MARQKKIDYASMFTLRKDGRYQGSYTDETGRHYIYDKDPERLWNRLNAPKEEKPLLFREIAEAWQNEAWEKIRDGTRSCYESAFNRAIDRMGNSPAAEIEPHEIATHLQILKAQGLSASTIKKQKVVYKQIFQYALMDKVYSKTIKHNPVLYVSLPDNMPKPKLREAPEDEIVKAIREKAMTSASMSARNLFIFRFPFCFVGFIMHYFYIHRVCPQADIPARVCLLPALYIRLQRDR